MANVLSSMQWDHYHSKWPSSVGEVGSDSPQMNDRAADAPLSPLLLSLSCCSGWWEEGCQRRRGPKRRGRGHNTNKQKRKVIAHNVEGAAHKPAKQCTGIGRSSATHCPNNTFPPSRRFCLLFYSVDVVSVGLLLCWRLYVLCSVFFFFI